jgi:hypothetical protein
MWDWLYRIDGEREREREKEREGEREGALVEKSIETSTVFRHKKLAYGAPKNFYRAP